MSEKSPLSGTESGPRITLWNYTAVALGVQSLYPPDYEWKLGVLAHVDGRIDWGIDKYGTSTSRIGSALSPSRTWLDCEGAWARRRLVRQLGERALAAAMQELAEEAGLVILIAAPPTI